MRDRAQLPDAEIVVAIEGTLDPAAASIVRHELTRSHPTRSVVLDLTHARAVHDLALAVVARALAADGVAVRFRGISQHQERMLRYLGLTAAAQLGSDRDLHAS